MTERPNPMRPEHAGAPLVRMWDLVRPVVRFAALAYIVAITAWLVLVLVLR